MFQDQKYKMQIEKYLNCIITIVKNRTSLIPDLEQMAKSFDGVLLKRQGKVTLKTKEGVDAVNEAIEFLKSLTPIQPLRWNEEISLAS